MNKYVNRVRSKVLHALVWPFLAATIAYGIGFTAFNSASGVTASSLYHAMFSMHPALPVVWGAVALVAIILVMVYLALEVRWANKVSSLLGSMVWIFASFCYILTGGWLLLFAVSLPNLYFWVWEYLDTPDKTW